MHSNYMVDPNNIRLDVEIEHENCREIVSSIVRLSSSLHLTVLAEFVETEEQKETLHEIGCDVYQGWLYSPAVFLEEGEK